MGLIAATTSQAAQVPAHVTGAILIGVDLGPNLSVTGSLATILWLIALRREGETRRGLAILKLGLVGHAASAAAVVNRPLGGVAMKWTSRMTDALCAPRWSRA